MALRLDGRAYSPLVLEQIVTAGAAVKSYEAAAILLKQLAEVEVSTRHVNNLTTMVGEELAASVCRQAEAYRDQPLPRKARQPEMPIELACVACDGGRMQTREPGRGRGVHEAHWRETKNAGFFRMKTQSHAEDPHPRLPRCFADRQQMGRLLDCLGEPQQALDEEARRDSRSVENWRPEVLFRTCLGSLDDSESFGWKMAAEADARGFFAAKRRAFLGDGQAYNWNIQKRRFPTFEPILDFIHPLEYLYQAAVAIHGNADEAWRAFPSWAETIWQGRVPEVLDQLRSHLDRLPPENQEARATLADTCTYLENNQMRMDYPRYRRVGLPVTSALIESLVKEVNYRVKGTEKFWNDDPRGAAILYVRAALLSHDDRLRQHLRTRPGSPFARSPVSPTSVAA